ncbi:hypothetical protein ACTXKN_12590 [Brachybacterium alimentarium]|uniref:hypothetical protein n=1 Tax=Brachybacterium alimentarium TaxID=47845 RepID=UPI003FD25A25
MLTSNDYYAATEAEKEQMLAAAREEVGPAALRFYEQELRDQGYRPHRADYPGTLAEARTATKKFSTRRTPTHRGVPRNA